MTQRNVFGDDNAEDVWGGVFGEVFFITTFDPAPAYRPRAIEAQSEYRPLVAAQSTDYRPRAIGTPDYRPLVPVPSADYRPRAIPSDDYRSKNPGGEVQ